MNTFSSSLPICSSPMFNLACCPTRSLMCCSRFFSFGQCIFNTTGKLGLAKPCLWFLLSSIKTVSFMQSINSWFGAGCTQFTFVAIEPLEHVAWLSSFGDNGDNGDNEFKGSNVPNETDNPAESVASLGSNEVCEYVVGCDSKLQLDLVVVVVLGSEIKGKVGVRLIWFLNYLENF